VLFDVRTAFDFLVSLGIAAGEEESDLTPEDAAWLERAVAALPEDVRAELGACFATPSMGAVHALPYVVVDRPEVKDAAGIVAVAETIGSDELVRKFLEDMLSEVVPRLDVDDTLKRIRAGNRKAIAEIRAHFDEWGKGAAVAFVINPEPEVERMRRALRAWLPHYVEIEPRVRRMIESDVEARAGDRAALTPADLIERTTGGLRWLPEPGVRRVVLAPSYFVRPFNHVDWAPGQRLFIYPIADSVLDAPGATAPPPAMVRLYRALGDSTRMRILRLLADKDLYLTEIAAALELSKPTTKHHLALLRAAGLVTVTEEGSLTWYSLRHQRIEDAGIELRRFLE
jgi:DNA-binding transcriptional ArsR family regulator